MDIGKAIEWLRAINVMQKESIHQSSLLERKEALYMAIDALKEVEQYHQIGMIDECRAAREKQIAKTPDYEGDGYADGQLVYDTWICPNCGEHYEVGYDRQDYCPKCGQHIKHVD